MDVDELRKAINEAEQTFRSADALAIQLARLLKGRLRLVSPWLAADIKRELRDFNIQTQKWKT